MRNELVALLLVTACTTPDTSDLTPLDTPEQQIASEASTRAEVDLLIVSLEGIGDVDLSGLEPEARLAPVANIIMANVSARWGACAVVRDISGGGTGVAAPSINFSACSGPRDLSNVTGTINFKVAWSDRASVINIVADTTPEDDLLVNGIRMQVHATAAYSKSGGAQTLVVSTHGESTVIDGATTQQFGDYTATWDATTGSCAATTGRMQTQSTAYDPGAAYTIRWDEIDLTRCPRQCPSGTFTHHFATANRTIALDFDPTTSVVSWIGNEDGSGTLTTQCP